MLRPRMDQKFDLLGKPCSLPLFCGFRRYFSRLPGNHLPATVLPGPHMCEIQVSHASLDGGDHCIVDHDDRVAVLPHLGGFKIDALVFGRAGHDGLNELVFGLRQRTGVRIGDVIGHQVRQDASIPL